MWVHKQPLRALYILLLFHFLGTKLSAQPIITVVQQKLCGAVQCATISYNDSTQTDWRAFDKLRDFLEDAFPNVHRKLKREIIGGHSLLFEWAGTDSTRLPVMLYAHQDVVPIETHEDDGWSHPAFGGEIADGYIWGRGTLDTKGLIIAMMEAAEQLLTAGFTPRSTIYFAFGHDEEVGGNYGAANIAKFLQARNVRLGMLLDEGLGVIQAAFSPTDPPVALIGMAEKGQANIELKVRAEGGHSSAPPFETAIGTLSTAIGKLQVNPMSPRLTPLVIASLKSAAHLMDGKTRFAMRNVGLLKGQIIKALAKDPLTDILIRTKMTPTIINGGLKSNVLPKEVNAILNVRLLQGDSIESVLAHIHEVVGDTRVEVKVLPDANDPSPVTSSKTPEFAMLSSTIGDIYTGAVICPALMPAGTDSKNFTPICTNIFRFSPFSLPREESGRVHNHDERISLQSCNDLLAFYTLLFQNLSLDWKNGRPDKNNHDKGDQ
jgi:carboxypeptidase PM20D1